MGKKNRTFSGVGGRLTLTADGDLYGVGWDLAIPYGVDYDPTAALAAPPVKIAESVISAAAGYNYGLYVTADGALHFIGSSGIPFAERFVFDGRIREVFAQPDRDVFWLMDAKCESYVWGNNLSGDLQPLKKTPRAVLDGQVITRRKGKAVWRYQKGNREYHRKGQLLDVPNWAVHGELRRRISENVVYRSFSAAYGENNLLLKYIRRTESEKRGICSPNWTDEGYDRAEELCGAIPRRPGVRDMQMEAYYGEEWDLTYSVGLYTINSYLFTPVKLGKEL